MPQSVWDGTAEHPVHVDGIWDGTALTAGSLRVVPGTLSAFKAALARVTAGTGPCRVLCAGDSTTMGVGDPAQSAGGVNSYPYKLGQLISAYKPWNYSMAIPQQASCNDGRHVASGWSFLADGQVIGWGGLSYYRSSSATPGNLTITPGNMADTIKIYYAVFTGNPTVPVTIDGVSVASINAGTGTNGIGVATYTVAAGSNHVVVLGTPSTTSKFTYFGMESYMAAAPVVQVANAGVGSSNSNGWVSTSVASGIFNGKTLIERYAPDLTLLMLGINDSQLSLSAATVTANMAALAQSAALTGSVVLMSVIPSNPTMTGQALQADYRDAVQAMAAANGYGFVDIYGHQQSYAQNAANGYTFGNVHLNANGYADVANTAFAALQPTLAAA